MRNVYVCVTVLYNSIFLIFLYFRSKLIKLVEKSPGGLSLTHKISALVVRHSEALLVWEQIFRVQCEKENQLVCYSEGMKFTVWIIKWWDITKYPRKMNHNMLPISFKLWFVDRNTSVTWFSLIAWKVLLHYQCYLV